MKLTKKLTKYELPEYDVTKSPAKDLFPNIKFDRREDKICTRKDGSREVVVRWHGICKCGRETLKNSYDIFRTDKDKNKMYCATNCPARLRAERNQPIDRAEPVRRDNCNTRAYLRKSENYDVPAKYQSYIGNTSFTPIEACDMAYESDSRILDCFYNENGHKVKICAANSTKTSPYFKEINENTIHRSDKGRPHTSSEWLDKWKNLFTDINLKNSLYKNNYITPEQKDKIRLDVIVETKNKEYVVINFINSDLDVPVFIDTNRILLKELPNDPINQHGIAKLIWVFCDRKDKNLLNIFSNAYHNKQIHLCIDTLDIEQRGGKKGSFIDSDPIYYIDKYIYEIPNHNNVLKRFEDAVDNNRFYTFTKDNFKEAIINDNFPYPKELSDCKYQVDGSGTRDNSLFEKIQTEYKKAFGDILYFVTYRHEFTYTSQNKENKNRTPITVSPIFALMSKQDIMYNRQLMGASKYPDCQGYVIYDLKDKNESLKSDIIKYYRKSEWSAVQLFTTKGIFTLVDNIPYFDKEFIYKEMGIPVLIKEPVKEETKENVTDTPVNVSTETKPILPKKENTSEVKKDVPKDTENLEEIKTPFTLDDITEDKVSNKPKEKSVIPDTPKKEIENVPVFTFEIPEEIETPDFEIIEKDDNIQVNIKNPLDVSEYKVDISVTKDFEEKKTYSFTTKDKSFMINNLKPLKNYYIRIIATKDNEESKPTNCRLFINIEETMRISHSPKIVTEKL